MTSDPLERSVISYIHGQFVIINEKSNVADAVKTMNKKNAETIIVTNYFDVGELDIIDSISLVFATITGGGFVPVSTFIIVDNIEQLIILMSGMILSALPYAFHYGLFSREIKARQLISPILAYFAFMTMSIVLFAIFAQPSMATNQ